MLDQENTITYRRAFNFVILLGIVSLFSDTAYEGARSINGQYLYILGASGLIVGIVAGLGEFFGYGIRLFSGYISDKSENYWRITLLGYAMNLFAIPLLALAGNWPMAAILMILERLGKGIRNPPRNAMLSHASSTIGAGWTFGLHEALDQIGAILGPIVVVLIYIWQGRYQTSYAVLLIPASITFILILFAKSQYPNPRNLEKGKLKVSGTTKLPPIFWIYTLAVGFIAMGFADFPLIGYHFTNSNFIQEKWIPILYSIAMGVDAIAALLFGKLFDKYGISILAISVIISAFFAPLVFMSGFTGAIMGMVLWGLGMGAHESIMSGVIAEIISKDKRGTAYGIYNFGFGLFWFLGSTVIGFLYDISILYLVIFSMIAQFLSIPCLFIVLKHKDSNDKN